MREESQQQQRLLSQDDEEDDTLMVCRCETPKILYDLLQSFSKHGNNSNSWSKSSSGSYASRLASGTQSEEGTLHKLHPMTIFCTKSGLTIHSQSSNKQFQASMELPASLFSHYRLMEIDTETNTRTTGDEIETENDEVSYDFTIHWQTFMQCLNLLMIGTGGDKAPSGNPVASFFRNHQNNNHSNLGATTATRPHSSLTLSYHTSTEVLRLEWEGSCNTNSDSSGGTVVATAAIPGLNPPPADEAAELSAAFGQSPITARWLCPNAGHELSDAKELDYLPGATTVRIRFLRAREGDEHKDNNHNHNHNNNHNKTRDGLGSGSRLRLSARGHSGQVAIEIPAPIEFSGEDEESGRVGGGSQTLSKNKNNRSNRTMPTKIAHTYSLAGWKRALQPLDMARETCLSVNARGILAVQHQLVVDTSGGSHRSKSKRRSSYGGHSYSQQQQHQHQHQQQPAPPQPPPAKESAFCDFLLLPLEVDEDRNGDNETDEEGEENYSGNDDDDDDDDRSLFPQRSTQRSLSQATRDNSDEDDDEEDDFQQSTAKGKRQRRRILSSTQESGTACGYGDDDDDDEGATNASVRLPIGSDDEEEEHEHGSREADAPVRRNLLFPTVTDGADAAAVGSSSNNTNHHSRRMERERRKRQRRSHQLSSSNLTSSMMTAEPEDDDGDDNNRKEEEGDNEREERSVNLLDDDSKSNGGTTDNDDDDDDRYCSSPELVYGQQG